MTSSPLRLYNTLTRERAEFTPLDPANVRLYVCGPTVYDYAHIGNARPAIVFDVLFRLLRHVYGEDAVTYVRNITDVDDKINARAVRDFPDLALNDAIRQVTEKTAAQYLEDTTALGCLEPTLQPRATENIPQMVALIAGLIERGHAYEAGGEVLFSVRSMPDYGQLSHRNLEDNIAGARVAIDAHKRDPADFVLWKQSSAEEPGWDSPWGRGRPGWHIECSAMAERYLGQVFDIHGGGLDLIFPHHENEIAQSRCAHGTKAMAKVWMHNGFVQVEGRKMSKSDGNFITIHDLLHTETFGGRKWPGEVLRLAMLMTHYREPIDFSVRRLEEAAKILDRWRSVLDAYCYRRSGSESPSANFVKALGNDLDVSSAMAELHRLSKSVVGVVMDGDAVPAGPQDLTHFVGAANLLGLLLHPDSGEVWKTDSGEGNFDEEIFDSLIADRLAALNAKDFAAADAIRADLLTQGVQLMDDKDPETGERRTKWELKR